jgi:hypothetical protein
MFNGEVEAGIDMGAFLGSWADTAPPAQGMGDAEL